VIGLRLEGTLVVVIIICTALGSAETSPSCYLHVSLSNADINR